jgi:ParB-like chromosome segregation protein Spo0J
VREVVDLLPLSHAPEVVAAYAEAMERGERFPPVSVVRLLGRFVLADGHKRLAAARSLGVAEVSVEVWPFTRLLLDQARQVRANAGKNARILRALVSDRAEARRLLAATAGHWRRVAASLAHHLRRAVAR